MFCSNPRCGDDLDVTWLKPLCWACRTAFAIGLVLAAPMMTAGAIVGRVMGWW